MRKAKTTEDQKYNIDYDLYSVDEIIKLINFFRFIEKNKNKQVSSSLLLEKYNEYRNLVNNKALEKKYDEMLYQKSQVSIYQIIKKHSKK